MTTLEATKREKTGNALRAALSKDIANDLIPAVVYGPKHESESILISLTAFTKILRDEGETSVLTLTGLGATMQVLVHDIDRDPVTTLPRHADFFAVEKGAKVTVEVPLMFTGESAAVKQGASLVKVLHDLEIEAEATHLPHEIAVDISVLAEIGNQIHVSDLVLPKGVVVLTDAKEVVALVQEVEVEEEGGAPDMANIAVEKKGKAEEA